MVRTDSLMEQRGFELPETMAAMVERTGGVPLFVEELRRLVVESGNAQLTGRGLRNVSKGTAA